MKSATFNDRCNTAGLAVLSVFSSLKTLAAAVAVVSLSVFSLILSFNLGEALNANGGWWLYPYLLAAISLFGFYLAGYVMVNTISNPVRAGAAIWLVLVVFLDVFAAWTMLCAADAKTKGVVDPELVSEYEASKNRLCGLAEQTENKATLAKMAAVAACDNASEKYLAKRDQQSNPLDYPAVLSVFYVTPWLKDDPEKAMAFFRLFVALVAALTPFVGAGLVVAHLATLGASPKK